MFKIHWNYSRKLKTVFKFKLLISTRIRALHARMSHSTICNTTVSTKKTRRTLAKYVRKLCVIPYACEGNAPVSVKKKYVFVQANNVAMGIDVCMCVIINQISSRPLLVCVCVYWKHSWKCCKRCAADVRVFVHMQDQGWA